MRFFTKYINYCACLLLLASCIAVKENQFANVLKKEIVNSKTGVVLRIPKDWGVLENKDKNSLYIASKDGHGFSKCRIGGLDLGDIKIEGDSEAEQIASLDKIFLTQTAKRFEKEKKFELIKKTIKTEKIYGVKFDSTHSKLDGSGISIRGRAINLRSRDNVPVAVYIIYSADIKNRAVFECSMLGKDDDSRFLRLIKAIAGTVSYKGEYYED